MKKILYTLLVLLIITGGILIVKKRISEIKALTSQQPTTLKVMTVRVIKDNFSVRRHFLGILEAEESADILSRVQASVTRVLKHEGDWVKKGQLLIELDSSEGKRESLKKKLAYLNIQQKNSEQIIKNLMESFQRDRMLYEIGGISKEQLQATENRLLEAQSALQAIKTQIEETKTILGFFSIKAPYDGVVSSVMVKEGDIVFPGRPLLKIELNSNFKVVVRVDTETIKEIKEGNFAELKYGQKSIKTTIARVYPSLSQGSGIIELHFNSRPFNLPTGAIVDVYLETKRLSNVFVVPEDAVLEFNDKAIIYRLKGNVVEALKVNILAKSNKLIAIRGNLQEGDEVVRAPEAQLLRLSSGTKVKVKT